MYTDLLRIFWNTCGKLRKPTVEVEGRHKLLWLLGQFRSVNVLIFDEYVLPGQHIIFSITLGSWYGILWILYSSHKLQVVPVGGEVKDHVITIMSSLWHHPSYIDCTIGMHDLWNPLRLLGFNYLLQHSIFQELIQIPDTSFWKMMIYDATFNFQFVSCKQLISKCRIQHSIFNMFGANNGVRISTFNFLPFEKLVVECNIQFFSWCIWRFDYWWQHSIFNFFV